MIEGGQPEAPPPTRLPSEGGEDLEAYRVRSCWLTLHPVTLPPQTPRQVTPLSKQEEEEEAEKGHTKR